MSGKKASNPPPPKLSKRPAPPPPFPHRPTRAEKVIEAVSKMLDDGEIIFTQRKGGK